MKTIASAVASLTLVLSASAQAFMLPPTKFMFEYVNEITGHYVLLDSEEAALVRGGSAGPGWGYTGYTFSVVHPQGSQYNTQQDVCRFYSPVHNSHFFTANMPECDFLRTTPNEWSYEKIGFTAEALPANGVCPGFSKPIYRVFNGRVAEHDANHRFTPDATVRDEMIAKGWKDEGIAFCTTNWFTEPVKRLDMVAKAILPTAECESRVGSCVALKQLPAMPNLIYGFLPPSFVNKNPDYPYGSEALTGSFTDLFTAQATTDLAAVKSHSFVQMYATGSSGFGIHINSADRIASPYAAVSPMYQLAGAAPAAGAADERLFPFKGLRHHTLIADLHVNVATVKLGDASSQAYGALVLRFGDAATGRSFLATVQAYGTMPPGDFGARDADTGEAIVSTVFRANPAFGTVLAGEYAQCSTGSACTEGFGRAFRFRIIDADFSKMLNGARSLDPALSADPGNYFLAQVRMQNETYGAAELGATVSWNALELWY